MPTRNVVLTDHQQGFVDALVTSGRYQNASEAMREGLRMLEEREMGYQRKVKALNEAEAEGLADIEAGRYTDIPLDEFGDYLQGLIERTV